MKMRKLSLLAFMLAMVISSSTFGQMTVESASATYTAGDILTDDEFNIPGESSACPGLLTILLPDNAIIIGVDVTYEITAVDPGRLNAAQTQLICTSTGGVAESGVYQGSGGWTQGTEAYSRTGLDIANNVPAPPTFIDFEVDFELHAGNTDNTAPIGCGSALKVDDGTWTVTIHYLPAGSPTFPINPNPADLAVLVDIDTDLSWDMDGEQTSYDFHFGTTNPPAFVGNFASTALTGTYDPGTMAYGTTYYWQVISKNTVNNTEGEIWSFTTGCDDATMPLVENFDGVTAPDFPTCWIPLSTSTNEYSEVRVVYDQWGNTSYSSPNYILFNSDAEPNPNLVLALPKIGTISDKYITFYTKNALGIWGEIKDFGIAIGTMSDPLDINTFTSLDTVTPPDSWAYYEYYFSDYAGTDEYIAFKSLAPQYEAMYLEDVTVDITPSCVHPFDMTATNISNEEANINWVDINGATEWELEVDTTGFTPTGVATHTATTNPYTLTNLMGNTIYDVYMRANCGGGDYSTWWGPLTFETLCDAFILPYTEDFSSVDLTDQDQTNNWPECWFKIQTLMPEFGGIYVNNIGNYSNPEYAFYYDGGDPGYYPDAELLVISPEIDDPINTVRLRFDAWLNNAGSTGGFEVGTISDVTDYTTFTPVDQVEISTENNYYTVYFDTYVGTDTHIAIRADQTLATNGFPPYMYVNNLIFETIPTCIEPDYAYVDNIGATAAWLNWDDLSLASDFVVEVGDLGFTPGTGNSSVPPYLYNTTPAASHSFEMTGLNSATPYDVYVRSNCGGGDYSVWHGPVSFMTGFDVMALPIAEDFESGFGITGNKFDNVQDWEITSNLYVSGANSAYNPYNADGNNTLLIMGMFDLTAKADMMLTFWHIAKTDGNNDHCYIEISTDGGSTFDQLPESSYAGAGNYREEGLYNNPEGPCFDEDSYSEWGTSNSTPENTWWKKEYFDLSDYNTFTEVVIRFRLVSNGYTHRNGWYIDDIAIETLGTPTFTVDPLAITEDATESMPAVLDMTMGNTGGLPTTYIATVVYDETDLLFEDFNAGIPTSWTTVNNGSNDVTWADTSDNTGYTFDDSRFVWADGYQGGVDYLETMDDELISPVIDASAYSAGGLLLEFDQAFDHYYNAQDTARVYIYDGTQWVEIYKEWNDDGRLSSNQDQYKHKVYDISQYANANLQIKWRYEEHALDRRGYYFALDNIRIRASLQPLGWLAIDGAEVTNGVALPDADNIPSLVDVMMDATGIAPGVYTADILVTSTDAGNPSTTIPVTMTVIAGSTVSGDVTYATGDLSNVALEGCTVELRDLSDAVLFTTTTDATGYYEFTGLLDGDYTVVTTSAATWGGLTMNDVNFARQDVAGTGITLSGLHLLAADVNWDGPVDMSDVLLMRQRVANNPAGTVFVAPDWIFETQSVNVTGGNVTTNYQGVCSGDADGSHVPAAK